MMLFEMPKVEVLKFAVEDVITVSGGGGTPATTEEDYGFFDNPCG